MPKAPSLCKSFYEWARPKLRPLNEARAADHKAGIKRYGAFHTLREQYLDELENLPFGNKDFHEYLDEDGDPKIYQEEIRERAASWFRNHSRSGGTVQLSKFESKGGVSETTTSRVACAAEMWAEGEKARIRKATCEALGIPVNTGNKALPSEWIGTRKSVVKREFASLPQEDQDEWNALASRERDLAARDRGSVIAIQERQKGFASWLDSDVAKQTKGRALGDVFFFKFSGYFVRAEDKQLERFRGQVSSDPTAAKWFQSDAYVDVVAPLWTEFIHKDVGDRLLFKLGLPPGAGSTVIDARREELTQYFEEMFRIDCDFSKLDEETFWKAVLEDPAKFVHPDRLPNQIVFQSPMDMLEEDFLLVYKHVWRCQNKPDGVPRESRFIYEPEGIRQFITRERAHYLRKQQKRRARDSTKAADASGAAAAAPQVDDCAAGAGAQTTDTAPRHTTPPLDDDSATPPPAAQGSEAPVTAQDGPVERADIAAPRATPSGEAVEGTPGAKPRAPSGSASATPAPPSSDEGAATQPATSGRRKAVTGARNRGGANAKADAVPAVPKGRKKAAEDADKMDDEDEINADATPPKAQKAKAAPRARKSRARGGNKGEEHEGEELPAKQKGKAAPRPRKRPAPDNDDEEFVDGASPPSKSKAQLQNKRVRVDPEPDPQVAVQKPRYPTRGREKK